MTASVNIYRIYQHETWNHALVITCLYSSTNKRLRSFSLHSIILVMVLVQIWTTITTRIMERREWKTTFVACTRQN
jgi:hypothetical protein